MCNLISVIVPVYNAEKYLPQCIESILKQEYPLFELILIDDGSIDHSGSICEEYAKRDSRIVVIHQNNKGVSAARNEGIRRAKGEWIVFVDADDYVENTYLSRFNMSDEIDYSIQKEAHDYYSSKGELFKTIQKPRFFKDEILSLKDYFIKTNYFTNINAGPYAKLFSSKLIKDNMLFFVEGTAVCEDFLFTTKYVLYCKKIRISTSINYHYRIISNRKTLSHRTRPLHECLLSFDECMNNVSLFLEYAKLKELAPFIGIFLGSCLQSLKEIYKSYKIKQERIMQLELLKKTFEKNKPYLKFQKIKYKILLLLFAVLDEEALDVLFYFLLTPKNKGNIQQA